MPTSSEAPGWRTKGVNADAWRDSESEWDSETLLDLLVLTASSESLARLVPELVSRIVPAEDLTSIEVTTRQAELDSLVAQRAALSDLVALSTLNVSVSPSSEADEWSPPGFASGLQSGWNALRTVTAGLITLVGFLLPFIAVVMLVAIPVVALIFVLRRRR